jgi:hypothetical protein
VIAVPPLDAVNQPAKVKPLRVGVPGELRVAPVSVEPLTIVLPPCESWVTVKVAAVHVAVRVTLAEIVPVDGYVADSGYVVEPSLHPANTYPARINVFIGVTKVDPISTVVGDVGSAPAPPPEA